MRKVYLFAIVIILLSKKSLAQTTYTWVGGITGDYQVAANWSPVRPGAGASTDILLFNTPASVAVTNVPIQTIGAIRIAGSGNTVSFAANSANTLTLSAVTPIIYSTAGAVYSADFLTINLSVAANLTLNPGNIFGIADGTGGKIVMNGNIAITGGMLDCDVTGTGGTTINGNVTYTNGLFACVNPTAITWAPIATYNHAATGSVASAIPASIWALGSTLNVTGMNAGSIAPSGFTAPIIFANVNWNCVAQNANVDLLPANTIVNIAGTLTITSTAAKELRLSSLGKATINVGNYTQNGGILTLQASTDTTILSVSYYQGTNVFLQNAGTINGIGGSGAGTAILDLKGNVTKAAGTIWQSTGSSTGSHMIVQFSGTSSQNVNISNTWAAPNGGRCSIVNNNADLVSGLNLTGTLRVFNSNSGSSATFTMNGKITGTGNVAYASSGLGSTSLLYTGGFIQITSGIEYPATSGPYNLTINNSLGLTFPAAFSRTLAGTLSMISGNLTMPGDTLLLANTTLATQLNYVNGYITAGTLGRTFPTTGLPTSPGPTSRFPFGTGINDRSINLCFSTPNLSAGMAGIVYATHTPIVGVTAVPPTLNDNGIVLDKKTNTNWLLTTPGTGGFNLGSGGEKMFLIATAANIGAVDDFTQLRLTDGVTSYGSLIASSGSNSIPTVGKLGLIQTDLNKPLYIGSNGTTIFNPLTIITFNWTGLVDSNWTNAGNWTGISAVGYPSASTEIAIINNASAPFQPKINGGTNISLFQLTVTMSLRLDAAAVINVYDNLSFSGAASFAPTSTFGYASSNAAQTVLNLAYGNLILSGTGVKSLSPSITVTGNYDITGNFPIVTSGSFTYAGIGAQRVAPTTYYDLTFSNNRLGNIISLGPLVAPTNKITILNNFVITATNYVGKSDFNMVGFSSAGPQTIPGFIYSTLTNSGNGTRTFDPLGTTVPLHVISVVSYTPTTGTKIVTGSKFLITRTSASPYSGTDFNDVEIAGNMNGKLMDFSGNFNISGNLTVTATNFYQGNSISSFNFIGGGTQIIPAFKTTVATNTPAFKFYNVNINGGARDLKFAGANTDTIGIRGTLTTTGFSGGNGFNTDSSTVNFAVGSISIPVLTPKVAGSPNYNNITISGGTKILSGDMTIGGNLEITGADTALATLLIGAGSGAVTRTLNILGNLSVNGITSLGQPTGQLDMNPGTSGTAIVNLGGTINVTTNGQLIGTGASNGTIVFKGILPHNYFNNANFRNGFVNFKVGDGVTSSKLTLLSKLDLVMAASPAHVGTLSVLATDSIDCKTYNISGNNYNGTIGNAAFILQAGATLVTENTGGIEGTATSPSTGSIVSDASMAKTYDPVVNYMFTGSSLTDMSFPASPAIFPMANLTIGDSVTNTSFNLNKPIVVNGVLTLRRYGNFALGSSDVTLISTATNTARVAPLQAGAIVNYTGAGRFNVERNYRGLRRAWCLITSPLRETGSIFSTWQDNGGNIPGRGTFVTGSIAGNALNGLDDGPQLNNSLKVGSSVAVVNDTKGTLLSSGAASGANIGYFLFVRGDRNAANFLTSNWNATTLSSRGKIQTGSQSFPASSTAGAFNLIGNPYASPVSFINTIKTNLDNNTVYVWDPYLNATVGAYATIILDNAGIVTNIIPGSPGGLASVGQPLTFQSSQAFWVRTATNGAASLQFNETDKSTLFNVGIFRQLRDFTKSFQTNLNLVEANDSIILSDGNLAQFDNQFSKEVNLDDILKFGNVKEMLAFQRDSKSLSVERRPEIVANDTLFFKLTKTAQRNYQFQFVPTNMAGILSAFLEDNYTKVKTIVSLATTSTFNFTINGDAASAAADRFRIVITASGTGPLPVTYKTIKAYQQGKSIAVDWTVENEINIAKYDVEKSTDGANFKRIGTTTANGANGGSRNYDFLDVRPENGSNFYRILSYNESGALDYSNVVVVKIGKSATGIGIYPNPVTGSTIGLALNNMTAGDYSIRLINTLGQILMNKRIRHATGSSMEILKTASKLSAGTYQLKVTAPDSQISTIQLIVP